MDNADLKGHRLKVEMSRSGGRDNVKPGDWPCPSCRVNNFARRDVCFRCGERKPYDGGGGGGGGAHPSPSRLSHAPQKSPLKLLFAGYDRGGGGGYDRGGGGDRY